MRALPDGPLRRLVDYYEAMTPASLAALGEVYAVDVAFKDPFNDIRGLDPLRHILGKMYEDLEDARFVVTEAVGEGDQAFLIWDFTFRVKRWNPSVVRKIHGATHVFYQQGLRCCSDLGE